MFKFVMLAALALAVLVVPNAAGAAPYSSVVVLCENKVFDGYAKKPFVLKKGQATDPTIQKVIRNCTFKNSSLPAVVIQNAQNVLIENSSFENIRTHKPGVGVFGVSLICSKGCKIDNITIRNSSFKWIGADGIQMGVKGNNISNVRVENSYFEGNDDVGENGIDIKGVVGPIYVGGNTFKGFRPCDSPKRGGGGTQDCTGSNGPGMVIHTGTSGAPYNVTVEDNTFTNNIYGLVVSDNAHNIMVRGNRFLNNIKDGQLIDSAYSVTVQDNTFSANPTQIQVSDTPQKGGWCVIWNNQFTGGTQNVKIKNSSCTQ